MEHSWIPANTLGTGNLWKLVAVACVSEIYLLELIFLVSCTILLAFEWCEM